jgi:DUF4097 and DUF4098 domain-containing protein YvlB
MPTFDTPEPIFANIDLVIGNVRINASDRTDTVVEVRPGNEASDADAQAAAQTCVEYAGGELLVKAPRSRTRWLFWRGGAVDVTIDLPAGSRVDATSAGDLRCEGRLGESKLKSASGDIRIEVAGQVELKSANGNISVTRSVGNTEVTTVNGEIRIQQIDGTAVVKTANGHIAIGEVTGDARLSTAYGDITVDRALANVVAKTAAGKVRISEVVRGSVALATGAGELELGVREGTAAWLDVSSQYGEVRSSLEASDGPGQSDETVQVRALTGYGDIVIRRA